MSTLPGQTWTHIPAPGTTWDIAFAYNGDIWRVRDDKRVQRYRNGRWEREQLNNIRAIAAGNSGTAWAVGDGAATYFFDGAAWNQKRPARSGTGFTDIAMNQRGQLIGAYGDPNINLNATRIEAWDARRNDWKRISGEGFRVGAGNEWFHLDNNRGLWTGIGSGSSPWHRMAKTKAYDVADAPRGHAWFILLSKHSNTQNKQTMYRRGKNGKWVLGGKKADRIDAGPDGRALILIQQKIYRLDA